MKVRTRFTPEWIQSLKAALPLSDIVGENVELRKSGARFMGRCPFHGDRSPSFSVNREFYYCFGCKETGDLIKFVMQLHGLSFEEACEELAEKAKLPLPEGGESLSSEEERALRVKRERVRKAVRLHYFSSLQFYHDNLLRGSGSPLFLEAREYLKSRGISPETVNKFQIGVAGGQHDGLVQFLTRGKAPLDVAREFGLIRTSQKSSGDYDFFRERILFPLIDPRGRILGFGGRILPSIDAQPSEFKLPKYLNSAESELFQKSRFLYGLYQAKRAIREEDIGILVEGYFDVVSLHQAGIENVVAPCGTAFTEDHLKTLTRLASRLIIFFDQDEAGITATRKAMEVGLKAGVLLYGIRFESRLDPDEFLLEDAGNLQRLKKWISEATPLLDRELDRIFRESEGDIERRSAAIKQAIQWLTLFADPVGRAVRLDQLVRQWGVPPAAWGPLAKDLEGRTRPSPVRRPAPHPQAREKRVPLTPYDRQLLHYFVKARDFGSYFLEARRQMHEKDSLPELFDDTEVRTWVRSVLEDPAGWERLKQAPETCVQGNVSQELQSVIMEGLLQERIAGEESQLLALLRRGVYKSWARFSHRIREEMLHAEKAQDIEKFNELSQQFLDLQRKLKEFEESYVSGKND